MSKFMMNICGHFLIATLGLGFGAVGPTGSLFAFSEEASALENELLDASNGAAVDRQVLLRAAGDARAALGKALTTTTALGATSQGRAVSRALSRALVHVARAEAFLTVGDMTLAKAEAAALSLLKAQDLVLDAQEEVYAAGHSGKALLVAAAVERAVTVVGESVATASDLLRL